MIQIIRDGNKKKYIHKCIKCKTVFSYQYSDTYEKIEEDKEDVTIKNDTLQKLAFIESVCQAPCYINYSTIKPKKPRYCICQSCVEENEVEFTKKTLISLIRMVRY